MRPPLIIWTQRRSGGTSLSDELRCRYSRIVADEPFNKGRVFGDIAQAFRQDPQSARLRDQVGDALDRVDFLKHCTDFLPLALHRTILEISVERGWRHLVLSRRDGFARAVSLEFATQTGIWGPEAAARLGPDYASGATPVPSIRIDNIREHIRLGKIRDVWLRDAFAAHGVAPFRLTFEEAYRDRAVSDWAPRLARYVAFDPTTADSFVKAMEAKVAAGGQETDTLLKMAPNIADVRTFADRYRADTTARQTA